MYPLLDPEDLVDFPADKKSVVTYLSEVYKGLKGLPAMGAGSASDLDSFAAQLIANHKASKGAAPKSAPQQQRARSSASPSCKGCGEPLSGQTAEVGTSEFHLDCFKCQGCGKKLAATQGGSLIAVANLPYCESCGRTVRFITHLVFSPLQT